VRLRMAFGPRLLLRGRLDWGCGAGLNSGWGFGRYWGCGAGRSIGCGWGCGAGCGCRTILGLRRRLRLGLGCGTVLGLNRTVLRLLGAELRPWLGLGLDGARLRLDGTHLRLLRLNGANLLWGRPVVRLELWLSGPVVRVHGSDLGFAWTRRGLTRC